MEIDGQQKLGDDRMSDCRSFGSNYHPCSQSRKISIGVMVDLVPKTRSGATKEDEVAVPNAEKVTSNKDNSLEGKKEGQGVRDAIKGKQTEAPEKESSPWISTRSKTPTLKTVHNAKQNSSSPDISSRRDKFNGVKDSRRTYSVQFVANQTSILQSGDYKQKKIDRVTYKRKGGNGTSEGVEEFSFGTGQEILGSNKGVIEDEANKTENISNENLKMKLWEILGSVSSPNKQFSNSQTLDVDANNLKREQSFDQKGNAVVKPRQNSDTIETDSESPNHTVRRPVTRSLTRKRAPTKAQPNKNKNGPSSSYKQKHQEKNIFSFGEGWSGRLHGAVSGGSSMSKMKKSEKKSSRIDPRKICFLEKANADKIQQASDRSQTPPPAEKTSSLGSRMRGVHNYPPQNNREYVKPKNGIQEKDYHQSPVAKKTDQLGDFDSPAIPENTDQQEDFGNPSNIVDPQDDFQSPTFGMKTRIRISSPSSPAEKTSSLGSRMRGVHNYPPQNNREYVKPKNGIQEKDYHQSPVAKKTDQLGDFDSPAVPENTDQQEDFGNPSLKNIVDSQDDFQSPTFGMKTRTKSSSPGSPPKTDQREIDFCSPVPAGRRFTVGDINSFRTRRISKSDCSESSVQTESSDGTGGLKDSPTRNSALFMGEKDAVLSKSSSEERDSESSEEDSPIIGGYNCCREKVTLSPETGTAEKPKYMLHQAKRLRSHGGIKFNELSPTSPSPKGTEESNGLQGPSEKNQEDGLSRAVTLFALALERLESKMKLATRKKSSEILMSAAEGINLQLLNVESQIQTDVGKLTSLRKSKRKRLETRFQEQQEKLKLIHERFKEEVNQYLKDCSSTLEGLEANQTVFKGTVERQKASHRKLLLQVEEAVGTQLNDAQRRITSVQKLARGRMLQLKQVIAECLKDGILS